MLCLMLMFSLYSQTNEKKNIVGFRGRILSCKRRMDRRSSEFLG